MSVPFSAQIVANDAVMINTFADGESVLLNLDTERYFTLNASGSRMWECITTEPTVEAAYRVLLDEFDGVQPDELRADLAELVGELMAHRLVSAADTSGQNDSGDAGVA